jgi:hypothetical protein
MVNVGGAVTTPGANTKTANLVSGTYSFLPKGAVITLYAKGSAAGIAQTLMVGGVPLINDQLVMNTGTTGTINRLNDGQISVKTNGGIVEYYLRNTTATAGTTCDWFIDAA